MLRLRSTELEASVVELTRARDELRRSNEVLGVFASQVAHDLRGPITALTASLGILDEDAEPLSEQQARLVDRAGNGVRRVDELVEEVLRTALSDGAPRSTDVDLASLLVLVLADLAVELEGVYVVAVDLPVVSGDATQLRIVLQNPLSIAVEFGQPRTSPRSR